MRFRIMVSCLVVSGFLACLWPTEELTRGLPRASFDPQSGEEEVALAPAGDTWIRPNSPNTNFGADTLLYSAHVFTKQTLLQWDQDSIEAAVGSAALVAARVELRVHNAVVGTFTGQLGIHRITQHWTEADATFNCAIDANTANSSPDCTGETDWSLDDPEEQPWPAQPTDTAPVANGQTGTIAFDVTEDVEAFLEGTNNEGWIVLPWYEPGFVEVKFHSRETSNAPRLILTIAAQGDTSRPVLPTTFVFPNDSSALVASPADTALKYYRRIIGIRFDDTTSGLRVRQILQLYNATIIGGLANVGEYIVQVPDPGPSFHALDSLISRITHEPGVDYAASVAFRESFREHSRFPIDGSQVSRTSWFGTATDGTRAWRAIRAPMAWGCETGVGLSAPPRVGVLDFVFDTLHPDLQANVFSILKPGAADVQAGVSFRVNHGTQVAGLVAAVGDNNDGIAGMIWRARLHLYAFSDGSQPVRDASIQLANVIWPTATAAGVRIFVSSVDMPTDSTRQRRADRGLARYLSAGDGAVFIKAAGNDGDRHTAQQLLQLPPANGAVMLLKAAIAASLGGQADRVIFVLGTNTNGDFWPTSNLITGLNRIAAPATNILTLVNGGGTAVDSGTSFAAPFVAGVAAQILAMYPTISTPLIKHYILEGAKEPRRGSNGVISSRQPISGVPGGEDIFELDAYGSLSLLARENPDLTPICGAQVWAAGSTLFVEHSGGTPIARPVAGALDLLQVSVAPGGRRVAIVDFDQNAPGLGRSVLIRNQFGGGQEVLEGMLDKQYLERDTADLTLSPLTAATVLTLSGPGGTSGPTDLGPRVDPSTTCHAVIHMLVSPSAEWAAVNTLSCYVRGIPPNDSVEIVDRFDLIQLTSARPPAPIQADSFINSASSTCPLSGAGTDCGIRREGAWSRDSRRFVLTHSAQDYDANFNRLAVRTRIHSATLSDTGSTVTVATQVIPDRLFYGPRLSADGILLIADEASLTGGCTETTRLASTPATVLSTRTSPDPILCSEGFAGKKGIFNVRAAGLRTNPVH